MKLVKVVAIVKVVGTIADIVGRSWVLYWVLLDTVGHSSVLLDVVGDSWALLVLLPVGEVAVGELFSHTICTHRRWSRWR